MLESILKIFIGLLSAFTRAIFGESLTSNSDGCMKCVSLYNQPCQARPTLVDISSNEILL